MTQKEIARMVIQSVLETVKEAGPVGAPSGPMYAALMTKGMSLDAYMNMMDAFVDVGIMKLSNDCYIYIH